MLDIVPSQATTARWDFATDLARFRAHGFPVVSVWRPKLSDLGIEASAAALNRAGVRVSSLHAAGGFTGGDGRSFTDSVEDALEAVDTAGRLGAGALVLHCGCRGGHTRAHASRLVCQALAAVAPAAHRAGVMLALKPLHAAAATGLSFLTRLDETLALLESCRDPGIGMAIDLWHFGDAPELVPLVPQLADRAVVIQVADRRGPPEDRADRLPPGRGTLPLESLLAAFIRSGYRGAIEVDPVGETVEAEGYEATLGAISRLERGWSMPLADAGGQRLESFRAVVPQPHRPLAAGTGSRRSQASSQVVSPR